MLLKNFSKKSKTELRQQVLIILEVKQSEINDCVKQLGSDHPTTKKVMNEWFGMLSMAELLTEMRF